MGAMKIDFYKFDPRELDGVEFKILDDNGNETKAELTDFDVEVYQLLENLSGRDIYNVTLEALQRQFKKNQRELVKESVEKISKIWTTFYHDGNKENWWRQGYLFGLHTITLGDGENETVYIGFEKSPNFSMIAYAYYQGRGYDATKRVNFRPEDFEVPWKGQSFFEWASNRHKDEELKEYEA